MKGSPIRPLVRLAAVLALAGSLGACSALEFITGAPASDPCAPAMLERMPVTATDSLTPSDSVPSVFAGMCAP